MSLRTDLKALWQSGLQLTSASLNSLLDNLNISSETFTLLDLQVKEAAGTLVIGQAYDVVDFYPTYKVRYDTSEYFTEAAPRPLRFWAKANNKLSNFGEMIAEDYLFEFDFTTSVDFPDGKIAMIWNAKNRSSILHNQKVWNGTAYVFTDLSGGGFDIGYNCECISWGAGCSNIKIGKDAFRITLGVNCGNILIGDDECNNLNFGAGNYNLTIGNNNGNLNIGNTNSNLNIGNNNNSLTFGAGNYNLTIGNNNGNLNIGNTNSNLNIGNNNNSLTFGDSNSNLTFGNNNSSADFTTLTNPLKNIEFGNLTSVDLTAADSVLNTDYRKVVTKMDNGDYILRYDAWATGSHHTEVIHLV